MLFLVWRLELAGLIIVFSLSWDNSSKLWMTIKYCDFYVTNYAINVLFGTMLCAQTTALEEAVAGLPEFEPEFVKLKSTSLVYCWLGGLSCYVEIGFLFKRRSNRVMPSIWLKCLLKERLSAMVAHRTLSQSHSSHQ